MTQYYSNTKEGELLPEPCRCGETHPDRVVQVLITQFDAWYGDKAYKKHDEVAGWVAAVREAIAADIEAYQPAAHPVSCPPAIAYAAAMETAARIAREGAGEADRD